VIEARIIKTLTPKEARDQIDHAGGLLTRIALEIPGEIVIDENMTLQQFVDSYTNVLRFQNTLLRNVIPGIQAILTIIFLALVMKFKAGSVALAKPSLGTSLILTAKATPFSMLLIKSLVLNIREFSGGINQLGQFIVPQRVMDIINRRAARLQPLEKKPEDYITIEQRVAHVNSVAAIRLAQLQGRNVHQTLLHMLHSDLMFISSDSESSSFYKGLLGLSNYVDNGLRAPSFLAILLMSAKLLKIPFKTLAAGTSAFVLHTFND